MAELRIMGKRGDDRYEWDSTKPETWVEPKKQTEDALKRGCLAFKMLPDGQPGERIFAFDSEAERIIIAPQMQGGI